MSAQNQGIQACPSPYANHSSQFADGLFIFVQADDENMERIKVILETYYNWFGQKVNLLKFVIIFSKNLSHRVKNRLARSIGINASNRKEKYLGIPMASGKDKKTALEDIIEKVKLRLQGWKMKTLSRRAELTLSHQW